MPIPADNPLFAQLAIRQTTRNNYNGASIPATHLEMLQKAAQQEGVQCRIMTREDEIDPVIELVKAGCIRQFKNPDFVHELVHWIRFNKDRAAKKHDGLYSATTGNPNVPEWFGKLYMDLATSAEKQAWKCEEQIRSSSGLVVFIGQRDDIQSWVNVGRSFERFALKATDLGIHHAHENMACEERPVREELAALLGLHNGEQPLLLVRIGYSEKMPYSYRRPVEEVLIAEEASVAL
jgi:nitroreductase